MGNDVGPARSCETAFGPASGEQLDDPGVGGHGPLPSQQHRFQDQIVVGKPVADHVEVLQRNRPGLLQYQGGRAAPISHPLRELICV